MIHAKGGDLNVDRVIEQLLSVKDNPTGKQVSFDINLSLKT